MVCVLLPDREEQETELGVTVAVEKWEVEDLRYLSACGVVDGKKEISLVGGKATDDFLLDSS